MALDTADKRFAAVNLSAPWRGIHIFPSGTVDAEARVALVYLGAVPAGDTEPPEPEPEVRQTHAGKKKRRRVIVEIDDKTYEVGSEAQALALLERVKAQYQRRIVKAKPKSVPKPPQITSSNAVVQQAAVEIRQEIIAAIEVKFPDLSALALQRRALEMELEDEEDLIRFLM